MNRLIYILLVSMLSFWVTAGEKLNLHRIPKKQVDTGKVFFSNGGEWTGKINMTKGRKLQINTLEGMKKIPMEKIREIRLFPEKQEMEQKWMFPEAGKTRKEKYGKPYPIQHLKAMIILKNNDKISGHLFSTVLYLRPAVGKKKRIILMSKQRGKEGETFSDLVYPEQIIISPKNATVKAGTKILEFPKNYNPGDYEVSILGIPDLMEVKKTKNPSIIFINEEVSKGIFTAIKKDDKITVFWPGEKDQQLFDKVKQSINDMSDFFDQRELKAVYWPEKGKNVYSLNLMIRKAKTSLHARKSNPWRLIIQRWKYDHKAGKLLLSGKGWLFRGIEKCGARGPEIIVSDDKVKLTEME